MITLSNTELENINGGSEATYSAGRAIGEFFRGFMDAFGYS